MKKAFLLWLDIAIIMFFIIFVDFMLFEDLIFYWQLFYSKEIFIGLFIITILFSSFFVWYFFERHGVLTFNNRFLSYLKLYFAILWRALVIVIPIIGIIAFIYKGSIGSWIATIFIEILSGFPAIYWYLKRLSKINS